MLNGNNRQMDGRMTPHHPPPSPPPCMTDVTDEKISISEHAGPDRGVGGGRGGQANHDIDILVGRKIRVLRIRALSRLNLYSVPWFGALPTYPLPRTVDG
jgi:hypothetical protein